MVDAGLIGLSAIILLPLALIWLVLGFVGAYVAGEKGRDRIAWGFICFLTGIFGLIILAILPKK